MEGDPRDKDLSQRGAMTGKRTCGVDPTGL